MSRCPHGEVAGFCLSCRVRYQQLEQRRARWTGVACVIVAAVALIFVVLLSH